MCDLNVRNGLFGCGISTCGCAERIALLSTFGCAGRDVRLRDFRANVRNVLRGCAISICECSERVALVWVIVTGKSSIIKKAPSDDFNISP